MCGIAGYFNVSEKPADKATVKAMADKIVHRGPDGQGFWLGGSAAFAHNRLAIIDLTEAANQPMESHDGRYVMVFNGEIYNYMDLRQDMERKGHVFKTQSDVEVLLEGYCKWGTDFFLKLNGMFAVVILDQKTKSVTIARDRFGVKPLYYIMQNGVFAFASEAKAFTAHPELNLKLTAEGLAEYLTFMNFISDATLIKDVHLFPAGSYAQFNLDSVPVQKSQLSIKQYWDFRFTGNSYEYDAGQITAEIQDKFTTAVRRQLVSDVGFSSFLSGGVDSGSITAIASAEPGQLQTFTAYFDFEGTSEAEQSFDERADARLMAQAFDTRHHEQLVSHTHFEQVAEKVCYHLDEPRVGQSYMNYLVSGLVVERGEKVTLSGCGGDELFGGYPWRYYQGLPANNFEDYADGYYGYWRRLCANDAELKKLLAPIGGEIRGFEGRDIFTAIYPEEAKGATTSEELLNWSLYFEAKTFMNGLLMVEDKISMAHGLETRVPFLDNDLVDLACRIPIQAKLKDIPSRLAQEVMIKSGKAERNLQERRTDGKFILREMMKNLVPEKIYKNEKQGFSAPDATWFKQHSYGFLEDRLLNQRRRIHDVIDKAQIQSVLDGHRDGTRSDGRHKIWAFFNLAETIDNFNL